MHRPAAADHNRIEASRDPAATRRPSHENLQHVRALGEVDVSRGAPVDASPTLSVLSSDEDAILVASGEKAQPVTAPLCPARVNNSLPVAAFRSLNVLSCDAERIVTPSGENVLAVAHPRVTA